jgi:hypothetical protein
MARMSHIAQAELMIQQAKEALASGFNQCMERNKQVNPNGYTIMRFGDRDKAYLTHRFIYAKVIGPIPPGHLVCHKCDNKRCWNPNHLFAGTGFDNMHDMHRKGRANHPRGEQFKSAKLTEDKVREIRKMGASGVGYPEIAALFGIDRSNVSMIVSRKRWKHVA